MKFRIKKYKDGYVVEIQKKRWYGLKYWTHYIATSGMRDLRWHHSRYEFAENNLLNQIKYDTAKNSNI